MIPFNTSHDGPPTPAKTLAKGYAALAQFNERRARAAVPPSKPSTPPTRPPQTPPSTPGSLASGAGVDYPASWSTGSEDRLRASFGDRKPVSAGLDYPADWDTSPVDANDTPRARPERRKSAAQERRSRGAGVDYPADWKL